MIREWRRRRRAWWLAVHAVLGLEMADDSSMAAQRLSSRLKAHSPRLQILSLDVAQR
jgi:hypothetical protein